MIKIAFAGPQQAGKTTAALQILEKFRNKAPVNIKFADPIYEVLNIFESTKNRYFMQDFGSLARYHFGDTIFDKIFVDSINLATNANVKVITCDDIRREHELYTAKNLGFFTIYIDAETDIRKRRAQKQNLQFREKHISETEVPALAEYCDKIIDNSGTIEQFSYNIFLATERIFAESAV